MSELSDRTDAISISIHALHEESDMLNIDMMVINSLISIHALHEESDAGQTLPQEATAQFQSTLSMRRATTIARWTFLIRRYFNPRSP